MNIKPSENQLKNLRVLQRDFTSLSNDLIKAEGEEQKKISARLQKVHQEIETLRKRIKNLEFEARSQTAALLGFALIEKLNLDDLTLGQVLFIDNLFQEADNLISKQHGKRIIFEMNQPYYQELKRNFSENVVRAAKERNQSRSS